jgi:hypothetical protein
MDYRVYCHWTSGKPENRPWTLRRPSFSATRGDLQLQCACGLHRTHLLRLRRASTVASAGEALPRLPRVAAKVSLPLLQFTAPGRLPSPLPSPPSGGGLSAACHLSPVPFREESYGMLGKRKEIILNDEYDMWTPLSVRVASNTGRDYRFPGVPNRSKV